MMTGPGGGVAMKSTTWPSPAAVEPSHSRKAAGSLLRMQRSGASISRDLWVRASTKSTCGHERWCQGVDSASDTITSPGEASRWPWFRALPHLSIGLRFLDQADSRGDVLYGKATAFPQTSWSTHSLFKTPTQLCWRICGGGSLLSENPHMKPGFILTIRSWPPLPWGKNYMWRHNPLGPHTNMGRGAGSMKRKLDPGFCGDN